MIQRERKQMGRRHVPRMTDGKFIAGSSMFNPKTEVDRGDLIQSAGREGHSSEITVSLDTLISSSCPIGSASCIISSPPTSDFGLKPG
jgi:hypothetical protein